MFFNARLELSLAVVVLCLGAVQAPVVAGQSSVVAEARTPGKAEFQEPKESAPPADKSDVIDLLPAKPLETNGASKAASHGAGNLPNFVFCDIVELRRAVPELRGLKAAQEQEGLTGLLGKVGAETIDIARETPDLISHEAVEESQAGVLTGRENFSYLILSRRRGDADVLVEFRVDLATGEQLQNDEAKMRAGLESSGSGGLDARLSSEVPGAWKSGGSMLSQGFASMWVYFYPLDQPQSAFRYLGHQKMHGHETEVLAFAQKPGAVLMPTQLLSEGKSIPIYFQGVAWVDASNYRIVRLRADLLSRVPEAGLNRVTVDVQYAQTGVAGAASSLWLPRDVVVTTDVSGVILRDEHKYSNYRAFRVQTKMLTSH